MIRLFGATLLIGVMTLSGCSCSRNAQLRADAMRVLNGSNKTQLTADATALWNQYLDPSSVPETNWPPSFKAFKPVRISRDSYGIYIITAMFAGHTAGVYIVINPDFAPNNKTERISEGIYWSLTP